MHDFQTTKRDKRYRLNSFFPIKNEDIRISDNLSIVLLLDHFNASTTKENDYSNLERNDNFR